jgi:rhodanese-related sulfurtransferase
LPAIKAVSFVEAILKVIRFLMINNDMYNSRYISLLLLCGLCSSLTPALGTAGQEKPVQLANQAVLATPGSGVNEVSTADLQQILTDQSAVVLDTRPFGEWSVSHIPGALNVAPKPGVPMALYTSDVAEIGRLVSGDKSKPLVLYCNGPFCGKSKRVAGELIKAGYTNVRRYQLGAPTWRALVGLMVIESEGARYVYQNDKTAVWVDGRNAENFQEGSIPGAKNIPRSGVLDGKDVGEIFAAKNDGRLPMEDHNTRIVVFALDGEQARVIAAALAREAFHNVTYFAGTYEELKDSIYE